MYAGLSLVKIKKSEVKAKHFTDKTTDESNFIGGFIVYFFY